MATSIRAVLLTGVLLLTFATSAAANTTNPPANGCLTGCSEGGGGVDGESVTAEVVFGTGGGSTGTEVQGGSSYLEDCNWQYADTGETHFLHPIAGAWETTFDEPHWLVWCAPQFIVYTFFPAATGPPASVIDDMIADAYSRTPVVAFAPQLSPEGSAAIPLVTQMRTWLWVDDALWAPVSAQATLPPITVTTTATPYRATWTAGHEPGTVICAQGVAYQTGIGGEAANDDSCTTVFTRDSEIEPGQQVQLAVRWQVVYTCTAYCAGGPLPDIITNSVLPVEVTEIQAVGR